MAVTSNKVAPYFCATSAARSTARNDGSDRSTATNIRFILTSAGLRALSHESGSGARILEAFVRARAAVAAFASPGHGWEFACFVTARPSSQPVTSVCLALLWEW